MRYFLKGVILGLAVHAGPSAGAATYAQAAGVQPNLRATSLTAPSISFGTASAQPGDRAQGYLIVPSGVDPELRIPVTVVRGVRSGPTVALLAGLHGSEFGGIVALNRLQNELDPRQMAGTVVIVPVVNTPGFEQIMRRVNPVDGKNMNRFFPGNASGTQTERAADVLTREVLQRVDAIIDYHGGDLNEDQTPYSYWVLTSDSKLVETERGMLAAFGMPFIIKFPWLETDRSKAKLLPTQAVMLGRPAITVDAGRTGTYTQADIDLLIGGTRRTLSYLGVLSGPKLKSPSQRIVRSADVDSPATGLFFPLADKGQTVRKGQLIGTIQDYFGRHVADVRAPDDAIVLYRNSTPSSLKGEQLFFLAVADRP